MINATQVNLKPTTANMRKEIIKEINEATDDELLELYRFILYFRLGRERLQELEAQQKIRIDEISSFEQWLAQSETLSNKILRRRQGKPLNVDALWQATRDDLESRNEYLFSD